jgi:hypothetical protein
MHAVLDGEATPEEARELDQLLAGDAGARAEFDALRSLFSELRSVPRLDPPTGLAEAVWGRLQLSRRPRVGVSSAEPGNPLHPKPGRIRQVLRSLAHTSPEKEKTMSQISSKRTLWIGIGVAAAAILIVGYSVIDYPPGGANVAGTVAPAERYRAEQIKAEDVKLGDQAVAQLMQTEAFDRFVRDPKMLALAQDPAFQALARKTDALAAMVRNPEAFIALARPDVLNQADALKAEATRAEALRTEARAEALKTDATRAEARAEALKAEAMRADARAEALKTEALKAEALKAEALKAEARAEALRAEALRADARAEARKTEALRAEALKAEAMRAEATKAEALKADARRAEALKAEAMKADARAEALKTEATKAEAMRADARAQALKTEATKAEARAEALRVLATTPEARQVLAMHPEAFAILARDSGFAALAQNRDFANALANARFIEARSTGARPADAAAR